MKKYKTRKFKDSTYKRYKYHESDMEIGKPVCKTPDEKVGVLYASWLTEYFPFQGIVTKVNNKSVDVQIYGHVNNITIGGKK